jgi:tRNA 5-methylaminomethyl-2-thiouridine biosynthesis bifunctional protein
LRALGLPEDYVQALDAGHASTASGLELTHPAWFYPTGGWVHPAGLARAWLERAVQHAELRTGCEVHTMHRTASGWRLLDATGATLGEAPTVVLANGSAALQLLGNPGWPVELVRGQISGLPAEALQLPRVPVAGAGYLLPAVGGRAVFGATAQRGDADGSVREADHRANLDQLAIGCR